MKDCDCTTHHDSQQHMDAIAKEHNHALLAQALAYTVAMQAAERRHDRYAYALYRGCLHATLECYAQAELRRLKEKERAGIER